MKVSVLCNDGSPLGVTMKTLWGTDGHVGVGGAELAMLTMCEEWTKAGHEVVLYNNPKEGGASPFEQRSIASFDANEERDVLIIFRSPNVRSIPVDNCLKVWWSTDQMTTGDFKRFSETVDKIVCISPRHADFFASVYGIINTIVVDLPVRIDDYDNVIVPKVPKRLIFTSVPARGLDNLRRIYPIIQREVPDVSLVLTSDYRLWGAGAGNEQFRVSWMGVPNVEYVGAIPRRELIIEQLKSQITLYPGNYDELFCIAIAESQYAGSYPISSGAGSLTTTNMGTVFQVDANDPRNDMTFAKEVVYLLNNPEELEEKQNMVRSLAYERFRPGAILDQWDKVFDN